MIDLQNKNPKILVIGDLMIDHYIWGSCNRISPEAPVQVVNVSSESIILGGAGNVINNLNTLGAYTDVISVIGVCSVSNELKSLLKKINIDTRYLVNEKGRVTSKKSRIIAEKQQVVRYDQESTDEINNDSINKILSIYKKIVSNYDVVLMSDYGKGVLTSSLSQSLIKIAKENRKKILVDPKGFDYSKYNGSFLLTPNKKEAGEATNILIEDDNSLLEAITDLKNRCNLEISLITLSEMGVAVYDDELRIHPTVAREVFDVTGAGDTVLASLGFALACNKNIDEAIKFANLASGVVVSKIGSATASINEIIEYESSLNQSNSSAHIKSWQEISAIASELKSKDKKIVFTNGCFDILHIGHIKYLEEAKSFGETLIIGLNSDASVENLKGKNRPINSQNDRAYILAALEIVDYVVIFDDNTPYKLIKQIQPDVLVKGGDYREQDIVGQEIVNELKIVDFIDGKSTTKTIERIRNCEKNYRK